MLISSHPVIKIHSSKQSRLLSFFGLQHYPLDYQVSYRPADRKTNRMDNTSSLVEAKLQLVIADLRNKKQII